MLGTPGIPDAAIPLGMPAPVAGDAPFSTNCRCVPGGKKMRCPEAMASAADGGVGLLWPNAKPPSAEETVLTALDAVFCAAFITLAAPRLTFIAGPFTVPCCSCGTQPGS